MTDKHNETEQAKPFHFETIGVKDASFKDLPEIKHLCPCSLEIKECRKMKNGVYFGKQFNVAKVISWANNERYVCAIYPIGNDFARETCEALFK
jgi:hypothetical protein